ncbi:MAG: murein biosynthesis integral membrane protein MurJ [Opitutaceae bacterium]|nr:murein biosynthesis integral membrane protein MurJ [Opitutaceae bacterium]
MSKSFKNISVVASATMVSRFLGLARDMLVTAVFGVSALASSFYTAFTLPNLFRRLLGEGALTAAFVPTLNEELRARQRPGAFALVNNVASWLLVVSGGVVLVSMLALLAAMRLGPEAQALGLPAGTVRRWIEAADLAVILFPYLACVCLAAVFSAALQTFDRFLEPALSPIWLNVAMLALLGGAAYGGWAATAEGRMLWLCAGALLGGVLQLVVPALALMREGWRPRFDFTVGDPLRQILRLMGPTVFGSAIYLINMAVSRFVGHSLNDSAVTVLNLASRLMELPIGVFAVAISTVIFPLISKFAAAGDWPNLAAAYRKGMRLILVINVPAAVGLGVLAAPIIRLLFQRGAFDAADTALMAPVLMVYALGLPFFSFVNLVLRAFYAQKDTATPVRAAVLSFVVNLALSAALMRPLGTVGLAIAGNVAVVAQAWYLQRALTRKHPEFRFGHLARDLGKVIAASAVMGVAVALGWRAWAQALPATGGAVLGGIALHVVAGVAIYGGLLWAMKIEGRDDLAAVWVKLRTRFG